MENKEERNTKTETEVNEEEKTEETKEEKKRFFKRIKDKAYKDPDEFFRKSMIVSGVLVAVGLVIKFFPSSRD